MKQTVILHTPAHVQRARQIIDNLPLGGEYEVIISPHKKQRNNDQNRRMWAMLTDISEQVEWYGNKLSKEEWKDVISAAVKRQKVVVGVDGGFVVIGAHTSKMSVAEMSELIECAMAFGCQQKVRWSDPQIQEP